jgi:acetolactate synthase-1/2/3 large subunit
MGWSCGAVIGGKIARPERRAVSLVGDGAFLMNGSEIGVAAKYGIGTVTIVLQDNYLGTVNHGERASADRAYSIDDPYYSLGTLDLEAFSRALGARSHGVRRPSQLWPCLADAFERAEADKQPQVVVAHIDHRVCPPYGDRFSSVSKAAGGGPPGAA